MHFREKCFSEKFQEFDRVIRYYLDFDLQLDLRSHFKVNFDISNGKLYFCQNQTKTKNFTLEPVFTR